MKPYIYGRRSGIHIIDIRETLRGLLRAKKYVTRVVNSGDDVLFVGTKRQAREIVQEQAGRCNMHYVSERWLGGTLTNFRTIRSRLQRLEELETLVGSPQWDTDYSKKMKSTLSRELKKIRRNLDGIRKMNRLPGVLMVIDSRKEHNAVREARALGIPTIALLDTDSDPDVANIVIPGNDDSMRSVALVVRQVADAVEEGMKGRPERKDVEEPQEAEYAPARRRGGGRRTPGGRPGAAVPRSAPVPAVSSVGTAVTEVAPPQPAEPEPSDAEVPAAAPSPADSGADAEPRTPPPAAEG